MIEAVPLIHDDRHRARRGRLSWCHRREAEVRLLHRMELRLLLGNAAALVVRCSAERSSKYTTSKNWLQISSAYGVSDARGHKGPALRPPQLDREVLLQGVLRAGNVHANAEHKMRTWKSKCQFVTWPAFETNVSISPRISPDGYRPAKPKPAASHAQLRYNTIADEEVTKQECPHTIEGASGPRSLLSSRTTWSAIGCGARK